MPQIFLLTGTTTWAVPDDCVSAIVDTIGAGSGGATLGGAGAGGAWARGQIALTPRAVITVGVGVGGASGSVGGNTYFNATSLANAVANGTGVSVGAAGGSAPATTTGGTGGTAAASVGGIGKNNGGNGGSLSTDAGGGGGGGGPNGAGNTGANGSVGGGGAGGQGDGASGGTGGAGATTGTAGSGNPGTEYDGTHGSGGGGGGCTTGTAGNGGSYGAGGGGALTGGIGGAGSAGLIVINYVSAFVNKRPVPNFGGLDSYDESAPWLATPKAYNASLATSIFPKTVLRPGFYAPRPADDFPWQGSIENYNASILFLPSTPQVPFKSRQKTTIPDDASTWQQSTALGSATFYTLLNASASKTVLRPPFIVPRPADDFVWQQRTVRNVNLLVANIVVTPFKLPSWKFGQDDFSSWQFKAPYNFAAASSIQFPTVQEGFYNTPDDSSGWQRALGNKNINLAPGIVATPFTYYPWKFGLDDASGWQGQSIPRIINLVPVVKEAFIYKPWEFSNDDPSSWQGKSLSRDINLVATVNEAFIYKPWKFGLDDASGWQGKPASSTLLVPILTAGGETSAPVWKFVTRPYDDPFWQFVGHLNVNVTNRPKIVNPPIQNWVFNTAPADTLAWQGFYWRNNSILFPTAVLMTDPRFVCSPNAPNSTLPSNLGSARNFVTTPQVSGMPYGNDFSVIDPNVETVTTTFNFDPWLGPGVTITEVVSVTVVVAKSSLQQDPNPQGIILGSAQIGPVPPAFPGVPAGAPNRAVLQQVSNCQPGVVYLLQCIVTTSDNQQLDLAARLPCVALN